MADGPAIEVVEKVKFKGKVGEGRNLSAAGIVGKYLLVAGDEDDRIHLLGRDGDDYKVLPDRAIVLNDSGKEADVEGIACEGDLVYVVGSHSRKRPKPKDSASVAENRRRLATVEPPAPDRNILVRFRLLPDGTTTDLTSTTLTGAIAGHEVLKHFAPIPSKENGVDIEGLAVRDGLLRVGFRGPVLQRGFVPVLTCPFATPIVPAETFYLNLGGRGIRDLERVDGGFLVLAGPVNDISTSFQLYFWDGTDGVPGSDRPGAIGPVFLGELPSFPGAKAEGLAVEEGAGSHYTALILFDGLDEGGALRLRVRKPVEA